MQQGSEVVRVKFAYIAPVLIVIVAIALYFGYRALIKSEPPEHVDLYGGGDAEAHRNQSHISGKS